MPEARTHAAAALERPAVRRAARRRTPTSPACAPRAILDFSGYVLDRVEIARVQLQLEDLHRGLSRGLPRRAVSSGSRPVRHVRRSRLAVRRPLLAADRRRQQRARASRERKTYERWHKAVLDYYRGETPPHGAIWLTYLPERDGRVVPARARRQHADSARRATGRPTSSSSTIRRTSRCSSASSSRPSRRRICETATEDDEIARAHGRRPPRAVRAGRNEVGPYQSPMEDGMQHFHEFIRRELAAES